MHKSVGRLLDKIILLCIFFCLLSKYNTNRREKNNFNSLFRDGMGTGKERGKGEMNKGKKFFKRSFCVILAAAMTLSLASCNKNKQGGAGNVSGLVAEASDAASSKEAVYRLEKDLDLGDDFGTVNKLLLSGDNIIYFNYYYDVPGNEEIIEYEDEEKSVYSCAWKVGDKTGNIGDVVVFSKEFTSDENFSVETANALPNGNLGLIIINFNYNTNEQTYSLCEVTLDGKVVSETAIDTKGLESISSANLLDDGSVVINADNKVVCFGADLKKTGEVTMNEIEYLDRVVGTEDGRIFTAYYDHSYKSVMVEIFPAEGRAQEISMGNWAADGFSGMQSGTSSLLEAKSSTGIYAINIEQNTIDAKLIMNFMDSDVISSSVDQSRILDDETIVLVGSFDDMNPSGIYKKVPADQVKDKKIITMGSIYAANYKVKKHVLDFNKTNDEYKIRLIDYEQYLTDDDFTLPEKQFRNDILSGMGPDIILTANMYDPRVYMNKGVFEDLTPYMEKAGINREDYLENILEAGSRDGKLYQLFPSFSLMCVEVKDSILEGKTGLTMQEAMDLEAKYNCKGKGFANMSKQSLLTQCVAFSGNTYYDTSDGSCNFDSEEFINTLKWINEYPDEEASINSETDYYQSRGEEEKNLRTNASLFKVDYLYDLRDFESAQEITFGEKVALIGFPGSKDNASGLISADLGFAINSKSENKDVAFDFIKYYISEEYQMPEDEYTYTLPILEKALDAIIEMKMESPYEIDPKTGKKEYHDYEAYSYLENDTVKVKNISAEDAARVKKFIMGSTAMMSYDTKINEIIKEESAAYFSGQKSAEDVAKIIQSRVSIYVQENQ